LGIPLGSFLIRWMDPETFGRICMAFYALIVTFGLSRVLIELDLATAFTTYSILTQNLPLQTLDPHRVTFHP
jgi:4-amino-4-deoxy-L-arabinose transferase-like glycosyltransferase